MLRYTRFSQTDPRMGGADAILGGLLERISGVVQTVKWYTAEDDKVCEFCQAQDGKEFGIEDNFYDGGDAIEGANGKIMTADYGDIEAPQLHLDCRCYIRPDEISME